MRIIERLKLLWQVLCCPEKIFLDGLTSGFHYEYFISEIFPRLEKRIKKEGKKIFVIFLDIDNLKEINDKFGYEAGDKLIKKFSEITRKNIRITDFFVRYHRGGDEFLVFLPVKTEEEVKMILERLNKEWKINGISVSVGVSEFFSLKETLQKAEQIMKLNKNNFKNRR